MKSLLRLLKFLRPHRVRLTLSIVFTAFFAVLSVLPPMIMGFLYDRVIAGREWSLLPLVALAVMAVPLTSACLRFVTVTSITLVSRRVLTTIRVTLYRKVMNFGMRQHSTMAAGAMVGRIMDDVNMLQTLLTSETIRILVDVIVFTFALAMAFSISPALALGMCFMLAIYTLSYRYYAKRISDATRLYRSAYDEIGARLQETVAGVRQVRIYNREHLENELFLDRTSRSLDKAFSTGLSNVSLSTTNTAIAGYGSAIIVSFAVYFVIMGRITYGDVVVINSYMWLAINPVVHLATLAGHLNETFISVGRIVEVLDEEADVTSEPAAPRFSRALRDSFGPDAVPRGSVEFKELSFSYDGAPPLFRGLSLSVPAGKTVALVGHTGCGKTSLVSLLMRYYDVDSGSIAIDGVDIRRIDLGSLRSLFGVVLQDPLIFDGTVAENISYGRPEATRAEIVDAARTAEIHERIELLSEGYDTMLGTTGVKLSVGEKQRLSIARAILRDPLVLIMDEATSSLDSESERLIQRSLTRVLAGQTSFIIAHRLSTISRADMIVVMDAGRITDIGTHSQLLGRDGHYRRLHDSMLGATVAGPAT